MNDLILGLWLLAGLSVALFFLGSWLGRTLPVRLAIASGIATCVALGAYTARLGDDVLLARLLPVSNLIVVGNWIPPLLSLLGGLAWSLLPRQDPEPPHDRPLDPPGERPTRRASRGLLVRRWALVLSLQAVGWFAVLRPIWGSPPRCRDRWEGDFCVQTTDATCTAACAATLLRAHGIEATEQEMADLCLTRRGTLWQGLYRGLKLRTAGTPWEVEIVHGPFDRLRSRGDGPAILEVGIPRRARVARIYTERYGWAPGEWHSVLFFGFRGDGRVAMGDPSPGIGREEWTVDNLRVLWDGRGMRLVRRHRGHVPKEPAREPGQGLSAAVGRRRGPPPLESRDP
jgi:hypothetical protein